VVDALRKFRRKLGAVSDGLEELPAPEKKKKQVAVLEEGGKRANKKRERVPEQVEAARVSSMEDENGDGEEDDNEQGDVPPRERKRVQPDLAPSKRAIADGTAGRCTADNVLVYFSLNEEMCQRENRLFLCLSPNGVTKVARSKLEQVSYELLEEDEKPWYLERLLEDVISRFRVNFPVLFACSGKDMMDAKAAVQADPACLVAQMDALAERAKVARVCGKVSPALSAANNTALMLAAALHKKLFESKEPGWREEFERLVGPMSEFCDLTFVTVNRYRGVGNLMLRSNVVACLLPSFVLIVEKAISDLLDDRQVLQRLETVFDELSDGTRMAHDLGREASAAIEGEKDIQSENSIELSNGTAEVDAVAKLNLCQTCKSMVVLFVCDAADGEHDFCWKCAGYGAAPLDELCYPGTESRIRTYSFCAKHIEIGQDERGDQSLSLPDFVFFAQAEEARQIVSAFDGARLVMHSRAMDEDWMCCFCSSSERLRTERLESVRR
jgi:hypothetical protein